MDLGSMNPDGATDEELTDEQIDQLVEQAQHRLIAQATVPADGKYGGLPLSKPARSELPRPYVDTEGKVAQLHSEGAPAANGKKSAYGVRKVEDPVVAKKKSQEARQATAGHDWYNLPRTRLTPELKRDLQLLRMRSVLDPKRPYKKDKSAPQVPKFSQVGTLIEGPTEFFSARIQNRDRKRTLAEEVMAGEHETGKFKQKYDDIQVKKTSGKKAHYKDLMKRRYGNKIKR
ncbi:MAG: hypothetical protein M1831_002910 [Alyxoria varia]|nr:MAG: hypothetical protein M1831_002910 [Alyxoria varia]